MDGLDEGWEDGFIEGWEDGAIVGFDVGWPLGKAVGTEEGCGRSGGCSISFSITMLLLNNSPTGRSTVPTVSFKRLTRSKYLNNIASCFEAIVSSSPAALSTGIDA